MKRIYWTAPSGRLHHMRTCSGGPGPRRMIRTPLTHAEWAEVTDKCRCAQGEWPIKKETQT
jgi:hypothetical protein